ncbi:MAG: ATP-binding protein [Deltaproteobacteria bacterium]|nr:ATP-binding protein [Deltaproteobacteria bacterium]
MEGRIGAAFDRVVADHAERRFPALTHRHTVLPNVPGKADAIVGMRRSGKTYLLFQRLAEIEASGVPRERTLYVSFEDERLAPLEGADLGELLAALDRRYPSARDAECWLLLDEVQSVPDWERFVRRVVDEGGTRVIVTGSSSKLLSREIATHLRGRSLATELLPFSFAEFLEHHEIGRPARWPPSSRARSQLESSFRRYLEVGGFPEIQSMEAEIRVRTLQEYVDVVVFRDVVERHGVSNTVALKHLVRRILRSPASALSIHAIHNDFRSHGVAVGKDSLHAWLAHLEDALLVFPVEIDATSEKRRMANPRKAYLVDHGLARAFAFTGIEDYGHHLENIVYLELRRRFRSVRYYRTRSGAEVDFVVSLPTGSRRLIQVAASLDDPSTRARELRALAEAATETGARSAEVVTLREEGSLSMGDLEVRIEPAYRWLLGLRGS